MICFNCGRTIKQGYTHKGLSYGPECAQKLGIRSEIKKYKSIEKNDDQLDLFGGSTDGASSKQR